MLLAVYLQDLDPLGSRVASTIVAALPVLFLFYLLVGRRWLASWAGAAGAVLAILIAWLVYGMPIGMAGSAFIYGAAFGLLPIGWTVFAAMLLYNVTVETGQFAIIRRSIGGLSKDARIQAVLIGFAFGAFMEGAAGAGSPVAICGAMLVGLGVPPFRAAVICLIANTSPVCFGGLGVPIMTLEKSSGVSKDLISIMCGHQLPIVSFLIPLYMVKCMCTWRQTLAIWPALAVAGGSFAVFQFIFATAHGWGWGLPPIWQLTDIGGGLFSLATLALFLKFIWKPREDWRFPEESGQKVSIARDKSPDQTPKDPHIEHAKEDVKELLSSALPSSKASLEVKPLTPGVVALAWAPWILMAFCLVLSGVIQRQEITEDHALEFAGIRTYYSVEIAGLHKEVERADRLVPKDARGDQRKESAVFKFAWLNSPGTPVMIAGLLSMVLLRMTRAQIWAVCKKTVHQMRIPIPTIAFMLGLSYVTKYAGMDATLGVAFASTGVLYPFFAAILGWVGVFLTGTDAGSNALFGGLQRITAGQLFDAGHLPNFTDAEHASVLICTANSTGGVMGKMIDAQSICVATAGTHQVGREADIFKSVIWHSVFLACIIGAITAIQAFVWPFTLMVPR
jgi:L-lactate transport